MHTRNRRGGKSLSSDVHAVCSLICFRSSVKWHFLNIPLQVITSPPRRPPSLSLVSLSSQHLPVWHYVFHFFLKLITCLQNYKGSSGRAQMGVCCFPALNAESWPHLRDSTGQLPDLWGNRLTAMTSFLFFFFRFIWLHRVSVTAECGISSCSIRAPSCSLWDPVPWPWMEPRPPALGVRSLNHWTTGKSHGDDFWMEE